MLDDIWRFRLLGDFQAQQGRASTDRFRTRKTGALLAYLAFHHHKAHTREELATLLWPEATPELGLKSLGVALSSLRKLLEPPGVPDGTVLIADRRTARLAAQAIQTDVAAFREALQLARQAADLTNRRKYLETAIDTYRGELLPGFYEDWILPERDLLTLAYRRALDELIGLLETSGQPSEALPYALKHAAGDPYDEKSYARVMRLYVAAGQPAEALRQYRTLELRLHEDLDEQPSEETQRIAKKLHAAYGERRDAPMAFPPLPEADASVSPLQSREVRLPLILTQFFGRESEIERLKELFKQRLITLTGPGGSGKTRLAVEALRRYSQTYDGRVLFVALADLSTADEIPATIRKVLRLPNLPGASTEMELTAALGTMPTLLLLDNLEHLLPVAETKEPHSARRFILHLLEQVPSLTVVVTSRQPLGWRVSRSFPSNLCRLHRWKNLLVTSLPKR